MAVRGPRGRRSSIPIAGTDIYEWLPGGFFLVHHVDVTIGDEPVRAIEMIGERDPQTGALVARSYDDTGSVTIMHVTVDDAGVMTFTGGDDVVPSRNRRPRIRGAPFDPR